MSEWVLEGPTSLGLSFLLSICLCFWQGSSDGISKSLEHHQGHSGSQVNGNNSTLTKEEESGHLPAASQCALSRVSNMCNDGNLCLPVKNENSSQEQKLETVAQQKEEWQHWRWLHQSGRRKNCTFLIVGPS